MDGKRFAAALNHSKRIQISQTMFMRGNRVSLHWQWVMHIRARRGRLPLPSAPILCYNNGAHCFCGSFKE